MKKKQISIPDPDNYYKDQLNRINTDQIFPAKVQFMCLDNKTNWLSLNEESAAEIIEFLKLKFNIQ